MKFKEINPGMVIHCPKEEDARALLEHLEKARSAEWGCHFDGEKADNWIKEGNERCILIDDGGIMYGNMRFFKEFGSGQITEFSDLIEPDEPQMSAVEVLEWLTYADCNRLAEVFEGWRDVETVLSQYEPKEIYQKITAYEAEKEEKPVEIEFGWHCEIFDKEWNVLDEKEIWEGDEEHAKDEAAERAQQYVAENGGTACYRVWGICRVKEDK